MVRGLLTVLLGGWLGCGCLLADPPDYEEPEKHWPVLVQRTPPRVFVGIDLDANDVHTTLSSFQAVAHDANIEEYLQARWFLDYDPESPESTCGIVGLREQPIPPTGEPERTVMPPVLQKQLFSPVQCRRLTLVVTDGQWQDLECTTVTAGSFRASLDWWLLVHDTSTTETEAIQGCHAKDYPLTR